MSSSAQRALDVLESIGRAARPTGVTAIANALEINVGTVYRSLDALERQAYVQRYQASTDYVVGPTAMSIRHSFFSLFSIRKLCLPYLQQLSFATGHTTTLTVRLGWYGVLIAVSPGAGAISNFAKLGMVSALWQHAAPQVLLAGLNDAERGRFFAWAERHIVGAPSEGTLRPRLDLIRNNGFCIGDTNTAGERGTLALPVRHEADVLGVLSLEGPVADPDATPCHVELPKWLDAIRAIESIVANNPGQFTNPFGHLDPDQISLRL